MVYAIINVNVIRDLGSPERFHETFHVADGYASIVLDEGPIETMIHVC